MQVTYAADAVVFAVETGSGDVPHVLLIKRRWDPFEDCWALPGGHMDDTDEDSAETARRELEEETGIALDPQGTELVQIGVFDRRGRDPRGRYASAAYFAVLAHRVEPEAKDDAADARWWPLDALPAMAFDHHEIIHHAVKMITDVVDDVIREDSTSDSLGDPLEPLSFAPDFRAEGYEIKPGEIRRWRGVSGRTYTDRNGWFDSPEVGRIVPVLSLWYFDGPMTEVS